MRHCPVCSISFDDAASVCPHDGVALVAEDPLLGRTIDGKYRVDAKLGAGGMGAVYRATQIALKRPVALKVIMPHALGRAGTAKRFEREAVAVARLKHPHIVAVHDFGVASQVGAYLVMELVEGETLREELAARGRLPLAEALPWMREICSAVHTAHTAGIVHRDLKPANIVLERLPESRIAKVLDFGIAQFLEESSHLSPALTQSGAIIGTPLYMSPEQCKGEPTGVASDVYSLGCIFYEMVTGQPPFVSGEAPAVLYRHVSVAPVPPSRLAPELPRPVEGAILRALAKKPADRFATAADFQRALADESGETIALPTTVASDRSDHAETLAALADASETPNNLPLTPSSFLGRDADVAAVRRHLGAARLVTIAGMGGIGKTRLAIRVASDELEAFPDGVWLVELATVADPALVVQAVASVLGVRDEPGRSLDESVLRYLRRRRALVVLDNCEHVVDACAKLAAAVTSECASARLLATSREPLGVSGERVWPLAPLALPAADVEVRPERFGDYPALALFVDRARMSRPGFDVTPHNAGQIADLCRRLDGIPLAIELAAARVKALSIPQISSKLEDGLRVLAGGARTALPRHRTLRAAIDWSYELLADGERALLRRASVFAGGWTLEAAEAICGEGDEELFDDLLRLVDKSLVAAEDRGDATRYSMAEVIRQYAREKLVESDEAERVAAAHLGWYLAHAEATAALFAAGEHERWHRGMEEEASNCHAALEWSRRANVAPDSSLRMCVALGAYWDMSGHWSKGRIWLERALEAAPDASPFLRARALFRAGSLAHRQGDLTPARERLEESLALLRDDRHKRMVADVLSQLGLIWTKLGDAARAAELLGEALELHRREGPPIATASTLHQLGVVALEAGDLDRADACFEESLVLFEGAEFLQGIGLVLAERAELERRRGAAELADRLLDECLGIARANGYDFLVARATVARGEMLCEAKRYDEARRALLSALDAAARLGATEDVARALDGLTVLAAEQGEAARALKLAGAAGRLREVMREPASPSAREAITRATARAREAIGQDAARYALEAGHAMTLDRAVGFALGDAETGEFTVAE